MLLSDDDCQPSMHDGDGFAFLQNKCDFNGMDTDEFSLIDEIFLANELNASIPSSTPTLSDSPIFRDTGDDAMDALKTSIDEGKPFESFEKQITITVPQPPPLDTDAIAIGGGLFQGEFTCIRYAHVLPRSCRLIASPLSSSTGITDHTNILPASLISPLGAEGSDYNIFEGDEACLLDIWNNEMN